MTAQATYPHSSLKKKEQSLTMSVILFDLSRHISICLQIDTVDGQIDGFFLKLE